MSDHEDELYSPEQQARFHELMDELADVERLARFTVYHVRVADLPPDVAAAAERVRSRYARPAAMRGVYAEVKRGTTLQ